MSSGATNQEDGMDDIRSEIDRRLRDDGISTDCTDDQKLVLVWKLYLHTEATLQTAIENEEKLKVAQTAEMQEVENYVEHIRHLSDEREALIQELETENDSLKMEIEMLKSDQNVSALRDETAEMLTQQGLEEIASVSTSEQIAFLLVERARLLDELEAEQNRSATPSPGRSTSNADDLQKTLEKERQEMQETLTQQQEQMKSLKDSLREDHEEEINLLMEENNKLEEDLQLGKRKVSELEKENAQLKDEIQNLKEKDKSDPDSRASTPRHNRPPSPGRTQNDVAIRNIIQEKTKIEGELVSQRSQLRNLQNENEKLTSRAEELEKEMENVKSLLQQQQHKNKMLKSELEETEQQLDDAENVAEDLTMEANKLKDTLTLTEAEVKELRAQLQQSDNMQDIVEILSNEKEQMTTELDTLKRELEEYAAEKEDLSNTLRLSSHKEEKLQEEIQNLQLSLESVQIKDVDLKSQKEELQKIKMLLETTKLELISVSNERDKFCSDKENLSKQNKELLNRLESIENDLRSKNISEGQEAAKQEIIINHIKEQNQKLSKDLHSLSSQIEEKNKKLEESLQKVEELQSENKDIGLKYNKELDDLRNKLQLTFSELGKSKSLLEEQYEQNSDLQDHIQKLESSLNEISASKSASNSDKDNLIQELRTKIEELEKTVSEKVSYEKLFEVKRDEIRQLERQLDDYEAVKTELDDTIHQLEKEKAAKAKLEVTVNDLEQIIDDQRQDNDKTQHSLLDKLQTHQNRIKALQDDLFTAQDELHNMREMHDKDLQKAHAITKELQDRLDIQKQQSIQAEVISATQRIEAQKLENLQRQIETMKVRLQEATLHNEGLSKDKSSLEHQVRVLEETVKQNDIYCQEVEQLRRELSSIQRERDHLQLATKYNEDDRQRHIDRIKSLEEISKQLELDNREVSSKLTEAEAQLEHLEDQLRKEKHKVTERQYLSNNRLSKVEKELTDTTKQSRELRDELQKKQTYIMKLEADAIGNAAKYESTIARLESELTDFKQYNKKELESTQDRLDVANRELKELRDLLRDKEQELSQALQESSRLKGAMDRMEAQLQTEVKIRTDMENRNSSLDQEVTKVWNQVKSLMDQNSSLEAAKRSLEDELERKKSASRYSESNFLQSSASQEAALKQALNRAEMADKRADRLQKDYNELTFKLKSLEHQVTQAEDIKSTLHDKKEQVSQLRNQLETEKLQRTLLDQTVSELKHQISLLKQRETKVTEQNCELQHTILDLEAKLEDLHERSQTAMEMDYNYLNGVDNKQQHLTEVGKRSMLDQIGQLQKEVKDLQYELLTVNERREVQERKYEERKLKTKSKLMKARDFYTKEKTRLQEQIGRMDEDLRMTRETLRKEMDWKEKMDKNYQSILHEKRDLLSQLADQEDTMREKTRMVTTLQVKSKYLEEENSRLMDRLETMTSPKVGLSKVLKTYKSGRERELTRALSPAEAPPHSFTGGTSGLGNSVDSSWTNEHDHYADHNILGFRSQTGTSNVDNYLNRNFCSSRTDLFRPHSPSEDSFTHEFDT